MFLTQEVISREVVRIPDLQRETRRDLVFGLVPGEHGLFFGNNDLLLSHEVIEREDKAPVKVALTSQGVIMHVCVLFVLLLPFEPPVKMVRDNKAASLKCISIHPLFRFGHSCMKTYGDLQWLIIYLKSGDLNESGRVKESLN